MKKWTTTSWIYRTFNYVANAENSKSKRWRDGCWTRTHYTPDYNALQKALNEVMDHCNRVQMAVKAVVPLTSAQTFEYGQTVEYGSVMMGGIGQGWGFSNIIGFAALLERVEEISEEEYDRRSKENLPREASPSIAPPPIPAEAM